MKTHWFPLIRPAIKPLFLGGSITVVTSSPLDHSPRSSQHSWRQMLCPAVTVPKTKRVPVVYGCGRFQRTGKKVSAKRYRKISSSTITPPKRYRKIYQGTNDVMSSSILTVNLILLYLFCSGKKLLESVVFSPYLRKHVRLMLL